MHMVVSGADSVNFFNPWHDLFTCPDGLNGRLEDNALLSATLDELSDVMGCVQRRWVVDPHPRWNDNFVLSGSDVGTDRRLWRLTPWVAVGNRTIVDTVLRAAVQVGLPLPGFAPAAPNATTACELHFHHAQRLPTGRSDASHGSWVVQPPSAQVELICASVAFRANWPLQQLPSAKVDDDAIGAAVARPADEPLECQPFELRPYWPLFHIIGNVSTPQQPSTCAHPRQPSPPCPANWWKSAAGECLQKCPKATTKRDPTFQRCVCDASTPCLMGLSCVNGTCCDTAGSGRPSPPCPNAWFTGSGGHCWQQCTVDAQSHDPTTGFCVCGNATGPNKGCIRGVQCNHGLCVEHFGSGPQMVGGWPTDGNALFKYKGHYHLMHQDHTHGTTWGHVVSVDLAHWTRVRPIFSPKDPYNRKQIPAEGQCDGSLSFPEGIGPVVLWTPDCDVGTITPPHNGSNAFGSGHDLPRAAVAFPRDNQDELLLDFVMQPALIDFGSSHPGGDPGRVWKSTRGEYWNAIFQINSNNLSNWSIPSTMQVPGTSGRFTSTDPKLLHWTLADERFARVVDKSGKEVGTVPGGIGAPMFYPIPNPATGGPDHIITSNEGEVWAAGKYDPQAEKMFVREDQLAERPVHGLNYLFTATGQAKDENRLLQAGWLWQGNWIGSNHSCSPHSCDNIGTGFSLVRDLRWDHKTNKLVGQPVPELSQLHVAQLVHEPAKQLNPNELWTLPIPGSDGSTVEIRLSVPVLPSATSVGIAALAPPTSIQDALQLVLNVSTPLPNGSRAAFLSVTNDFAPPWRNQSVTTVAPFLVLPDEPSVDIQIFVDRVVVEAFAMRARGAVIANEFRPDPQTTVHVFAAQKVTVNVSVWKMGCGYTPYKTDDSHTDGAAPDTAEISDDIKRPSSSLLKSDIARASTTTGAAGSMDPCTSLPGGVLMSVFNSSVPGPAQNSSAIWCLPALLWIPPDIRRDRGVLLAVAEGRKDSLSDDAPCTLGLRRSTDVEASWGPVSLPYRG
jgi:hypothetical protein